jgi:CRISPR-associated endonuclease/helicase Cas3
MALTILPVYSKQAAIQDVPSLLLDKTPHGLRLLQHQVQTYEALTTSEVDVVINIAMTGDGKSLAAQLPTLITERSRTLMAMCPTNELVSDQVRQFEQTKIRWNRSDLQVTRLDAHQLDQIETETGMA